MLRATMTAILALGLLAALAAAAFADTYKLVNQTGHGLQVRSDAVKFGEQPEQKEMNFNMGKEEKVRMVKFGHEFRLLKVFIWNKDNLAQSDFWHRIPFPTDPHRVWTLTVTIKNGEMEVTKAQN